MNITQNLGLEYALLVPDHRFIRVYRPFRQEEIDEARARKLLTFCGMFTDRLIPDINCYHVVSKLRNIVFCQYF